MNARILCALLTAGTVLAVSSPVAIPNAGLTIALPTDWSLDSTADAATGRPSYFLLPNDTGLHVTMGVELYDGLSLATDTAWAYEQSYAFKVYVDYMPCPSQVLSWASTIQNGLSSYYLNTTQATDSVCSDYKGWHNRYFAYADHGWEVYLTGDTAEVARNYSYYSAVMDSITVDRNWTGWTAVSIGARTKAASSLQVLRQSGALQITATPGARGELMDLRGRTLATFVLDPQGHARVAVNGLQGIYVVRTNTNATATVTLMR